MIKQENDKQLASMTTFGIPAECKHYIEYESEEDLLELFEKGLLKQPLLILGGGSNMLFTDGRFEGTVLHNSSRRFHTEESGDSVILTTNAGCVLDDICLFAASKGLWGPENLSGIPGDIGGAAIQNAGAYGTEMKDIVLSVRCFDANTGEFTDIPCDGCEYGYRDSVFKHLAPACPLIVTKVTINLEKYGRPRLSYAALLKEFADRKDATPLEIRDFVLKTRDSKLPSPAKTGSAGSFFKNPVVSAEAYENLRCKAPDAPGHVLDDGNVKLSAAWLIDHAGCKPFTSGGAALWQKQPLILINASGTASGADIVNLEKMIQKQVYDVFGVELHPEVMHI